MRTPAEPLLKAVNPARDVPAIERLAASVPPALAGLLAAIIEDKRALAGILKGREPARGSPYNQLLQQVLSRARAG